MNNYNGKFTMRVNNLKIIFLGGALASVSKAQCHPYLLQYGVSSHLHNVNFLYFQNLSNITPHHTFANRPLIKRFQYQLKITFNYFWLYLFSPIFRKSYEKNHLVTYGAPFVNLLFKIVIL